MPPTPKSIEQHKIDGTYRADRHAKRLNLPSDPPDVPSDLSPAEAELWNHIIASIPTTKVDALALRVLIESWKLYRRAYDDFVADSNKETRITWKATQDALVAILRQFGATPVSRSQIKSAEPPADKDDPFGDIMRRFANAD